MKDGQSPHLLSRATLFEQAQALALTVGAIRRARGKRCLGDFPVDSPEWRDIAEDFARDVLRALERDPESPEDDPGLVPQRSDDDYLGTGSAG
ncbi:MAG TPA: hypothetical protein VF573_07710 [Paraburkholderia sp.]|uniref:hypothetical protein n=1 Tax=Paraburkholderia sp. TaxID=1926495 RepID=UPI002ED15E85